MILRPANNLPWAGPIIDLTHGETVRIGMLFLFYYFCGNDPFHLATGRANGNYLCTTLRELLG